VLSGVPRRDTTSVFVIPMRTLFSASDDWHPASRMAKSAEANSEVLVFILGVLATLG
jgi:hypothetical protein